MLPWEIKTNPVPDENQTRCGTPKGQVKWHEVVATEWLSYLQQAWEDAGILRVGGRVEGMVGIKIVIPWRPE